MSLTWRSGVITSAIILFKSKHPWLEGQTEDLHNPGFFRSRTSYNHNTTDDVIRIDGNVTAASHEIERRSSKISLTLSSPNQLRFAPSTPLLVLPLSLKHCSIEADASMSSYYARHSTGRDDVSSHWIEG